MLFLTYNFELRPDWQKLVDPPAQGNMKDETYTAKLPELWDKKRRSLENDDLSLLAHQLTAINVYDARGKLVANDASTLDVLCVPSGSSDLEVIFGVHPHRALKKFAWQLVEAGQRVNARVWADEGVSWVFIDPYRISGASTHGISLEAWLQAFKVSLTDYGVNSYYALSPENQMHVLSFVAAKMGFPL